jgi:hypothetical protein
LLRNLGALAVGALVAFAAFGLLDTEADRPGDAPLAARFAVFDRDATSADDPRASARRGAILDGLLEREFGIDYDRARRLRRDPPLFAVPGDGQLCLLAPDEASCTPFDEVGTDLATAGCGGLPTGTIRVSGVVTDAVTSPRVLFSDGTERRVAEPRYNYLSFKTGAGRGHRPVAVESGNGETLAIPKAPVGLECAK